VRLSNIDLRFVAVVVLLTPFGALLIGPPAVLALGGAFLSLAVLALVFEKGSRVDAPGTEAGLATLFLRGIAAILGVIGAVMVGFAWRMLP
jgi:hypothetical protein